MGSHGPKVAPKGATGRGGIVVLLAVLLLGIVTIIAVVQIASNDGKPPAARIATATTQPSETTAAPTTTSPEIAAAQLSAAWLAQAAAERGYEQFYGAPENVASLAGQVCATITGNPTSAGVWTAAANLEGLPFEFSIEAAWGFVDLASTVYCPDTRTLVILTIADASS